MENEYFPSNFCLFLTLSCQYSLRVSNFVEYYTENEYFYQGFVYLLWRVESELCGLVGSSNMMLRMNISEESSVSLLWWIDSAACELVTSSDNKRKTNASQQGCVCFCRWVASEAYKLLIYKTSTGKWIFFIKVLFAYLDVLTVKLVS